MDLIPVRLKACLSILLLEQLSTIGGGGLSDKTRVTTEKATASMHSHFLMVVLDDNNILETSIARMLRL